MMKIQYVSDLHLEFPDNTQWIVNQPLEVAGDVLVIAGDTILLGTPKLENHPFFDWCAEKFKHTFLVPGNHEYYNYYDVKTTLDDFTHELRPNVTYCNNHSVMLGDTEIFFTTLWSKVQILNELLVQHRMTDCHRIMCGDHTLLGRDYGILHNICREWLTNALASSTAKHKVVVTHHCPIRVEDPRYKTNGLTDAFIVPMEQYIEESDIDYWIFGHTHYNGGRGIKLGKTTMLTNQLGYIHDGVTENFKLDACIEL